METGLPLTGPDGSPNWSGTRPAEIIVLAGAGITPTNAATVVRTGGVREIHFSARKPVEAPMRHRNPDVILGAGPDTRRGTTSAGVVAATVAAVADL